MSHPTVVGYEHEVFDSSIIQVIGDELVFRRLILNYTFLQEKYIVGHIGVITEVI